jgi:hypothetical protein
MSAALAYIRQQLEEVGIQVDYKQHGRVYTITETRAADNDPARRERNEKSATTVASVTSVTRPFPARDESRRPDRYRPIHRAGNCNVPKAVR